MGERCSRKIFMKKNSKYEKGGYSEICRDDAKSNKIIYSLEEEGPKYHELLGLDLIRVFSHGHLCLNDFYYQVFPANYKMSHALFILLI